MSGPVLAASPAARRLRSSLPRLVAVHEVDGSLPADRPRVAVRVECGAQDPASWLSSNERPGHWSRRSRLTRAWRDAARVACLEQIPGTRLQRVHVLAVVHHGDARRRDPANSMPTVKAVVDGMVDARVVPDDDAVHLVGPDVRLGEPTGWSRSARTWPPPMAAVTMLISDLGPVPAREAS